jgi:putative sigma-54 modulation protein
MRMAGTDVSPAKGRWALQIEVTVRHASIAEDLKAYAATKAERLVKHYDKVQTIHVVLDTSGAGKSCEMVVVVEHLHELVGRTEGDDFHACIDMTVDRLERQLTEHKERVRNRKGRGPNPHQPTRT